MHQRSVAQKKRFAKMSSVLGMLTKPLADRLRRAFAS
jgi:hypothetical protein